MANHTQTPRVAIITRTKDRGILLERAIKSIHQQTMTSFVHVIINDAGDPKVVDELVEKYKDIIKGRVKVIHNTESHGMEAASNKAIKSVDSEFVAIHDDDDSWHPDFLNATTEHLYLTGGMGVVVTTDQVIERIVGNSVHVVETRRWLPETHYVSMYKMCRDNYATPITFLYKRSVFKEIGYYDENLKVCGDWDFGLRFIRKWDIEFLNTEYALAFYHHRPESTGVAGNSVLAGDNLHKFYGNALANKMLRQDLTNGGLGLGYLFNYMKEDKEARIHQEHEKKHLLHEFRDHNIRVEASLQRVEKMIPAITSPKRLVRGTLRYAKKAPRKVISFGLRKTGIRRTV